MTWRLVIDPASAGASTENRSDLFASELEYSVAIAGIGRETTLLRTLPDALWLEVYAYEFVERVRDEPAAGELRIPFWPGVLFEAAGVVTHCWRELEVMLPKFQSIEVFARSQSVVEAMANRVLGELRFPLSRYDDCLRRWAESRGVGVNEA